MTIRTTARTTTWGTALAVVALLASPATSTAAPAPSDDRAAEPRTRLTFTVDDCEGCEIQLVNARSTLDADVVHVWESRTKKVRDGKVTFVLARGIGKAFIAPGIDLAHVGAMLQEAAAA